MKTKLFLFAALATLLFSACDQKNTPTTTTSSDPRDKFVGEYSYVATGNVDLYVGTSKITSIPLNDDGTFEISKGENENDVLIAGYGTTIPAVVSGNQLILESTTSDVEYGEIKAKLTFTHGRATLEGTQMSWSTTVNAVATYSAITATGEGQVSMIADKNGVN